MEQIKCTYGCNQPGIYKFKNGANCCSDKVGRCPSIRKKHKDRMILEHASGVRYKFSINDRKISYETRIKKLEALPFEQQSSKCRKEIILYEQNYKCLFCNLTEWLNKPIVLELDHIDGNHKNNSRTNLRCLCPNCHSQTDTWKKGFKQNNSIKATEVEILEAIKKNNTYSAVLESCNMKWGSIARVRRIEKLYNVYVRHQ